MGIHWKSILLFQAIFVLSASTVFAGGSGVVIASGLGSPHVAAYFEMNADFVVIPLSVNSRAAKSVDRLREVEKLHKRVVSAVNGNSKIGLLSGFVSLSPGEVESYPRSNYRVYESSSLRTTAASQRNAPTSISVGSNGSEVRSHLLIKLDESTNVFSATRDATQFINGVGDIGHAKASLGRASLGIDHPEQYRGKLLEAIAQEVELVKSHLSPDASVQVSGLESPVMVRQKDARVITVFINYAISISY